MFRLLVSLNLTVIHYTLLVAVGQFSPGGLSRGHLSADVEIVVDPGILVPRKYLSWQKIFVKVTTLNHKIEYNVR